MRKHSEIDPHISPWPTKHNGKRRCFNHDYCKPGFYLITLVCRDRRPLFGRLVDMPPASPEVVLSPFGLRVAAQEAKVISRVFPMVKVRYFTVMPDHLHIILQITERLPEGKNLGVLVNGFKTGCRHAFKALHGYPDTIFESGYNDRILREYRQLKAWYGYLDDNPRRLALKRRQPSLFTVRRKIHVNGRECDAVGNLFLLDIPDKVAVVVHRADTDADFERKRNERLNFGEGGGVLVSAAIAPREKQVMREAIDRGYSIIIVRNEGMGNFYKPVGEAFDACASGQLLQVTPFPDNFSSENITRRECLFLNNFAAGIADTNSQQSIASLFHGIYT